MNTIQQQIKAARNVATPLIGIRTSDPKETLDMVRDVICNGNGRSHFPTVQWDAMRGMIPMNEKGLDAIGAMFGTDDLKDITDTTAYSRDLAATLELLSRTPPRSIVFLHNLHRHISEPVIAQGLWNLRELFKSDQSTLVMLYPSITLPEELKFDIRQFEEDLPNDEQLVSIVNDAAHTAGLGEVSDEDTKRVVESIRGIPAFAAEQTVYESISADGISEVEARARQIAIIQQQPGLRCHYKHNPGAIAKLGGLSEAKFMFDKLWNGPDRPDVIWFFDEFEKSLSGAGKDSVGDSSGTSQDQTSVLLQTMENYGIEGACLFGHPGTGKTALPSALAEEYGCFKIDVDLGRMFGGIVGESQKLIRSAIETMLGVGGKKIFAFATMNSMANISPEMQRRFPYGPIFFDVPSREEKDIIWCIHIAAFNLLENVIPSSLSKMNMPDDFEWVGSDIRNCCRMAYRLNISLKEAALRIVPATRSDPVATERRRKLADGRFLDASKPGPYVFNATAHKAPVQESKGRHVDLQA